MNNLNRLREYIKESKYDGVILGRRDNYKWITQDNNNEILTSTEVGVAYLIVLEDELILAADSSDYLRMKEEQNTLEAECIQVSWSKGAASYPREYARGRRMASDTDISGTDNIQGDLTLLRMELNETEIERYREIGRLMANIVEDVITKARVGDKESDVAKQLKMRCIGAGVSPDCVLVGSDERILKYRHPAPTDKKIENSLMVVLGGEKYGLNISMTRMVYFGDIPDEIRKRMHAVQYVFASMQCIMEAGMSFAQYFDKVISLYEEAGYKNEWKEHHQGGPTGYGCREIVISPNSNGRIKNGYVFAWNPTIQGTKCEETTYLKDGKVEIFTDTGNWPRKIIDTPYGDFSVADIKTM